MSRERIIIDYLAVTEGIFEINFKGLLELGGTPTPLLRYTYPRRTYPDDMTDVLIVKNTEVTAAFTTFLADSLNAITNAMDGYITDSISTTEREYARTGVIRSARELRLLLRLPWDPRVGPRGAGQEGVAPVDRGLVGTTVQSNAVPTER